MDPELGSSVQYCIFFLYEINYHNRCNKNRKINIIKYVDSVKLNVYADIIYMTHSVRSIEYHDRYNKEGDFFNKRATMKLAINCFIEHKKYILSSQND